MSINTGERRGQLLHLEDHRKTRPDGRPRLKVVPNSRIIQFNTEPTPLNAAPLLRSNLHELEEGFRRALSPTLAASLELSLSIQHAQGEPNVRTKQELIITAAEAAYVTGLGLQAQRGDYLGDVLTQQAASVLFEQLSPAQAAKQLAEWYKKYHEPQEPPPAA